MTVQFSLRISMAWDNGIPVNKCEIIDNHTHRYGIRRFRGSIYVGRDVNFTEHYTVPAVAMRSTAIRSYSPNVSSHCPLLSALSGSTSSSNITANVQRREWRTAIYKNTDVHHACTETQWTPLINKREYTESISVYLMLIYILDYLCTNIKPKRLRCFNYMFSVSR